MASGSNLNHPKSCYFGTIQEKCKRRRTDFDSQVCWCEFYNGKRSILKVNVLKCGRYRCSKQDSKQIAHGVKALAWNLCGCWFKSHNRQTFFYVPKKKRKKKRVFQEQHPKVRRCEIQPTCLRENKYGSGGGGTTGYHWEIKKQLSGNLASRKSRTAKNSFQTMPFANYASWKYNTVARKPMY